MKIRGELKLTTNSGCTVLYIGKGRKGKLSVMCIVVEITGCRYHMTLEIYVGLADIGI